MFTYSVANSGNSYLLRNLTNICHVCFDKLSNGYSTKCRDCELRCHKDCATLRFRGWVCPPCQEDRK